MSTPTYMVSIQLDVFDGGTSPEKTRKKKIYYDLVELTPDQIKAIVKMTAILSRGKYDTVLPKPLENQVTGKLNI